MSDTASTLTNDVVRMDVRRLGDLRLEDGSAFTNPRTFTGLAPSDIRELALDILRRGVLVPLLVTEDGLIIAGSRRGRALAFLCHWENDLAFVRELDGPLTAPQAHAIDVRVKEIVRAIPVAIVHPAVGTAEGLARLEGIALADNLHRVELSGYEIAARLHQLHAAGATGIQLARLIGKSASYVSRKLSTWRNAGPELKQSWRDGMAEDTVITLAGMPVEEQSRALAGPVPRGRRGPAHRPSVDMVRDFLDAFVTMPSKGMKDSDMAYTEGVLDALRWVTGNKTSETFAKIAAEVES